jgi:hypothetical protein
MNTTTARVDIERLQILNDRLCQTLDALNQVRLSAHNVSYGHPQAFGQNAFGQSAFGQPFINHGLDSRINSGFNTPFQYGFNSFGQFPMNTTWGWNQALPQTVTPFATPAYWGTQYGYRPSFFGTPSVEGRFAGIDTGMGAHIDPRFHSQFSSAQPVMF